VRGSNQLLCMAARPFIMRMALESACGRVIASVRNGRGSARSYFPSALPAISRRAFGIAHSSSLAIDRISCSTCFVLRISY
jgi:hypothetical protein